MNKGKFQFTNSLITPSLIKVSNTNEVLIVDSKIKLCKLGVSGENNRLEVKGTSLHRTDIFIEGSNNRVVFNKECEFGHVNIYVLGSNSNINIGSGSSGRGGMFISCGEKNDIIIGNNCLFAHDIDVFASDSHQIIVGTEIVNTPKSIVIGDHVWVGAHCSIMRGVHIGENSVIGCRSVVTRDVAPNTLHVGSPNKCVKENIDWSIERTY